MRKILLGALLVVANFAFLFYMLDSQKQAIDEEIDQLYFIHLIQARQVRTLQNIEMRNLRPDIQKRLAEIKEQYDKLDKEEQDANKSERSGEDR
tara:strand:+ start:169 stop:450 length:282 start_codon:yes stop_codon:yes gene_type:complete